MTQFIGRLFGVDDLESIESVSVRFAAPWAESSPALVLFACAALVLLSVWFYIRFQRGSKRRVVLTVLRAAALAGLVTILAEPVVSMMVDERPKPLLLVLFDGTESMSFEDNLPDETIAELAKVAKDEDGNPLDDVTGISRVELIRRVLINEQLPAFTQLAEKFRIRAYVMDDLDQVREISVDATDADPEKRADSIDTKRIAEQLVAAGRATSLDAALDDLARRHRRHLAGVVVFSDFDDNAGGDAVAAAERLSVPLYNVGLGPREVADLSVEVQSDLVMKKGEETTVDVQIRQSGLGGRVVRVQLLGRRLGTRVDGEQTEAVAIATPRSVELDRDLVTVSIPYKPDIAGEFKIIAKVEAFDDEVVSSNNEDDRDVTVHDEALKVLFVEYEPTWEWRFVKEVFYRDKLVGREGFRTFLRSADFKVRRSNDVYLETLVRPRHEFFAYDVIFLSDVPAEVLSDHFQEMLREYVGEFGGGLVVMAGPRFGPSALADTKIADMLPVVIDPASVRRDLDYELQFTPKAANYGFMNLGADGDANESRSAWKNMGRLPWFQPVQSVDPRADVLAVHPTERCLDGETLQPIIAARKYNKGEVIYLGTNEFWRLRKKHGERYYRRFWGQMMARLGLSRSQGMQKRFQVDTDRDSYEAGDKVRVIIEAYDGNFENLEQDKLIARLVSQDDGGESVTSDVTIPRRDRSFYEAIVPVYASGKHQLFVRDPVTNEEKEISFDVTPLSLERRNAVRNFQLQRDLAAATGGKTYELFDVNQLPNDIQAERISEFSELKFPLWNTWLVLILFLLLLLGEWFGRKLMNLR